MHVHGHCFLRSLVGPVGLVLTVCSDKTVLYLLSRLLVVVKFLESSRRPLCHVLFTLFSVPIFSPTLFPASPAL